jgi:hypothetical protein
MSIDTRNVNLLGMVNTRMKKVAGTGGGEYHGPCPMCRAGTDRFVVQPHSDPPRWMCRQCHPKWGDAVELQQLLSNENFVEAVNSLGLGSQLKTPARPQMQLQRQVAPVVQPKQEKPREPIAAIDNPEWIDRATGFVEWSWRNLMSGNHQEANEYMDKRGIDEITADLFMLGYNPSDWKLNWGGVDVYLPHGLVIPYLDSFEGVPRKINIRRWAANAKPRYLQVKGGANWLYNHYSIKEGCIAVLLEGEIDAISIAMAVKHHSVVPVATGARTGARWLRWAGLLSVAKRVLVAFDDDEPGHSSAVWWSEYLKNARRLVPEMHDVNEMLTANYPIHQWIEKGL